MDADVDPDRAALAAEAGHVLLDPSRRFDRAPRRLRLATALLRQEEGGNAVADVLADDPAAVDDGPVDRRRQIADHREVCSRRELAAVHAGVLEVAEEDRRRPPRRLGQRRHPLEHPVVTAREHRLDAAAESTTHVEAEDPGESAIGADEPDGEPADVRRRAIREGRREAAGPGDQRFPRLDLVERARQRAQVGQDPILDIAHVVAHVRTLAQPPGQRRLLAQPPDLGGHCIADGRDDPVTEGLVIVEADEVAELGAHVAEPPLGVEHLAGQAGVLERPCGFGKSRIRRERVRISLRFHSAFNLSGGGVTSWPG